MRKVRLPVILTGVAWLALASALGMAGLVQKLPMPLPQVVIFVLTNLLLLLFWRVPAFQTWAMRESLRVLVLIHVTRFVGIAFLVLHRRGEMAGAFAVPAGWGDIFVAVTALLVCLVPPGKPGLKFYLVWNVIGFLDILMVVFNAARLGMTDPNALAPLVRFPLSLLPTFLVPVIIATHILIFFRLLVPGNPSPAGK